MPDTPRTDTPAKGSPGPAVPEAFHATPNAERYVLQADALRRQQLRAALLYGSSRYWRRRQRVWPAVIAGAILVAVVSGGIVVAGAFEKQQAINEERFQQYGQPSTSTSPAEPSASSPSATQ
ncbi:hypothetical protein NI17_020205 [Thermobifida halotolerans]|uniref:Uncharacterized protein n=1 Tax=Thermobifida halotolerans TaxID=483545 RepID=A0A399FTI9_9ACTN|nr:hypothetical protein [Thermobifida halotolerans]UOE19055.1 hypothetical protein NI17_020205 [Thermobifida halotolerans]